MTIPVFHTGDDWPITLLLNEANSSGVLVPFVNTGATFTVAIVNQARTQVAVAAVTGTLTATGCSATFDKANTAIATGTYRVEVQALQGGLRTSWSDSTISVVPGLIP